jgi:hypothetical protein
MLPIVLLAVGIYAIGNSKKRWLTLAFAVGSYPLGWLSAAAILQMNGVSTVDYINPIGSSVPPEVGMIAFGVVAVIHSRRTKAAKPTT